VYADEDISPRLDLIYIYPPVCLVFSKEKIPKKRAEADRMKGFALTRLICLGIGVK
jgi:hypothetical protein